MIAFFGLSGPTTTSIDLSDRRFALALAGMLGAYLVLQALYIERLPLVMDEFQSAAQVARFAEQVPYRDFHPYKTVLGTYLQLPVLLIAPSLWRGLLAVKMEMAILAGLTLGWAAVRLARRLERRAVVLAFGLLLAMSTFLERSAELRVEMLTGLAGLISLVLLVEGGRSSATWAGGWAAVAFLVSQKGAFFALAGGAAVAGFWLLRRDRSSLVEAVRFGAAGLTVGAAYYLFWAVVAGSGPLGDTVASGQQVLQGQYDQYSIWGRFWRQTVLRNPMFYLLAIAAWLLVVRRGHLRRSEVEGEQAVRLALFIAVLMGLCLWYEQPWPYFFVLFLPAITVLHAEVLGTLFTWRHSRFVVALVIGLGIVYPLVTRVPKVLARDSAFQRYHVETAAALLGPGETYLAGVDLLWNRPQAVRELGWIDRLVLQGIERLSADELDTLVRKLKAEPIKLVVWNHRMDNLPEKLRAYRRSHFRQVVGNFLMYSPVVLPGSSSIVLDFSGEYWAELSGEGDCWLDGAPLSHGQRSSLEAGEYAIDCRAPLRLTLVPAELQDRLEPRFMPLGTFFPDVYGY